MATQLKTIRPAADPLDDVSLPGWLYFDPEFFEAEMRAFLRRAPQVVCHESDIARAGEWRTLEAGAATPVLFQSFAWCRARFLGLGRRCGP